MKKRHTCCRFRSNPPSDDDTEYIGISARSNGSRSNRRLLFLYSSMSSRDRTCVSRAFSFIDRVSRLFIRINALSTARTNRLNSTAKSVSMKAFFSWAKREEYIADNPMTGIAIPRAPRKMVNTFTTDQIAALLNLCRSSNHSGHRNTTIILLFFDTGIRVSELVNISIDDVILDEGRIKIKRAKGN